MKTHLYFCFGLLCAVASGCTEMDRIPLPGSGNTETKSRSLEPAKTEPDNTRVNDRDRQGNRKTPIDQNENQSDVDLTAAIRRTIVGADMSVYARNIKVITQDGRVVLRGPVKTPEEKNRIHEIAVAVAGAGNVDNQLEIERAP